MTLTEVRPVIELTGTSTRPSGAQLMKEFISNRCSQGLLRFFVVHPNGRFSKLAVVHGIFDSGTRPEIEIALGKMIADSVVDMTIENTTVYYSLTRDEPTRQLVLNLAKFDWRQWQSLDQYYVADRRMPA
jgi:hypothetical protein